jgi:predicted ArsR family transcriptional regulator
VGPRSSAAVSLPEDLSADALAETALRISRSGIDEWLDELGDPSMDREVLVEACEQLRRMEGEEPRDRAAQHIAFSLVSALFERSRKQHRFWPAPARGARR